MLKVLGTHVAFSKCTSLPHSIHAHIHSGYIRGSSNRSSIAAKPFDNFGLIGIKWSWHMKKFQRKADKTKMVILGHLVRSYDPNYSVIRFLPIQSSRFGLMTLSHINMKKNKLLKGSNIKGNSRNICSWILKYKVCYNCVHTSLNIQPFCASQKAIYIKTCKTHCIW